MSSPVYVRVTFTGPKRDPKTGKRSRWSHILERRVATATAAAWRRRGYRAEISKNPPRERKDPRS